MKLQLLSFVVLLGISVSAQQINIIPQPVSAQIKEGSFALNKSTFIVANHDAKQDADLLNIYLKKLYGFVLPIKNANQSANAAANCIIIGEINDDHKKADFYRLTINKQQINIGGVSHQATSYGIQSFLQLLPVTKEIKFPVLIPALVIEDYPRFTYRGMHLDVGRHFFSVNYIKKYIDFMAMYKMNTFHWHLTEDQGWRIEIKKYPRLTEVGAYRDGTIIGRYPGKGNDSLHYGGYYTQEQIKEVIKYAADRYITIIPEIEMPGHSLAALTAYPELGCTGGPYKVAQTWGVFDDVYCAGNEKTFKFLEDVLDEVMQLFPSKCIHIGGDECPKTSWKKCPKCQQRIKDNNLKDEHELQSYFIQRIEKYINGKGRKIIGWDEILEGGLAPNADVMSWRGEQGGIAAAKDNHDVIMTPGGWCYFDHSQTKNEDSVTIGGYLPIETVYSYEPIPNGLSADEAKHILGAQANVWTEYIGNEKKLEYMIFPRISALSEVLWSPKEKRSWTDFENRLQHEFKRYDFWGVNYSKSYFDLQSSIMPTANNEGLYYTLESKYKNGRITIGTNKSNLSGSYSKPLLINNTETVYASLNDRFSKKLLSSLQQSFSFNKATGKKITLVTLPSSSYPGNGGTFGLVNGVSAGSKGINSVEWLGWIGKDMEAIIDFGKQETFTTASIGVLKQEGSWIYLPTSVEVFTSVDGKQWNRIANTSPQNGVWKDEQRITVNFVAQSTQFIKIIAHNTGTVTEGKPGAGNPAWLFVDEISVN